MVAVTGYTGTVFGHNTRPHRGEAAIVKSSSHLELLSAAMQMLAHKPDANVMIIVDDADLEVMQTHLSYVWSFGLLFAAEKMLGEQYRARVADAARKKMETQARRELAEVHPAQ